MRDSETVMAGLHLNLFGGFEARLASGRIVSPPTKKAQALLAYLAIRPGQRQTRDTLAALLWGERRDQRARAGLRQALMALRKALVDTDPAVLRIEGQTLALDPLGVEVDVATFERRVAEGAPEALEVATDLYRGDLLLGFTVNEPLFEEWLVAERERLREMALEALARLLAHQAKAATERAIRTAVRLLGLDPLQEPVHRMLMRLYSRQGRRGAALRQYQVCVGVLQRELGTEPEAETRKLYQEMLRHPTGALETAAGRGSAHSRDIHPAKTAPPPDLPTAETALFGRQAESGRLRQSVDGMIRGHGHIATVTGEAGIGKTRLVGALAADALSLGCRVLVGACHESDSILPFGPWVDACRSGAVTVDDEILGALHPTRRTELTRLFPEAGAGGLPPASDGVLPLFEGMAGLVEQVAARQPLILVLEDLHWADEMSLRLVSFISRRIPTWPALLIVTARAEELADATMARRTMEELSRAPQVTTLALSPLSRADTALLVRALTRVGSDTPTLTQVERRVWQMSEGNPFVVVEAMRALDQDRSLGAGAGGDPESLALPTQVRNLVARRLDRLSPRSQQLLAIAAVIGRRFDFGLLRRAAGMEEHVAAEAVEEVVRLRMLQAVGNDLDFIHDRVRDVVHSRLLPPRRRLLHRAVVEALEGADARIVDPPGTVHRDELGTQIEQLAHHALLGELPEKAVRYLRQAGLRAAARSALQDARALFEKALDVIVLLPESPETLEQAFEIRLELRPVLTQLGEVSRILQRLREAESLAERLDDDARRSRVYALLTNLHAMCGELDEALATGTRALTLAGHLGDLKLRILATTYLEVTLYYRGEYERVVELATGNLAVLPADWVDEYLGMPAPPSVYDRGNLVISLAELGRFEEAARHEVEATQLAERTRHAYTVGFADRTAAMRHLLSGNWATAVARLEHGITILRTGNVPLPLPILVATSAWALAQVGEASEALKRLREGEELLEQQGARGLVGQSGWVYQALGRACLLLGRRDEARGRADRAMECSSRHPGYAAHAQHLLGDIAIHPDGPDLERGEAHYRAALAIAEPRGMRPLVANCHLGLGTLHARAGHAQEARHHLTTAIRMYGEMDMRFWRQRAHAEARALDGRERG